MTSIRIAAAAGAAIVGLVVGWALAAGCGAADKDSPPARPRPEQCRSLSQLAPKLVGALEGSGADGLRQVIERNHLLDPQPDGAPSPVMSLMRVVVGTLSQMADDPPERGASAGQLCNERDPPVPWEANRMCEARRVLRIFVKEGQGREAFKTIDPIAAGVLGYVAGRPPATQSHYEVAGVLAAVCTKTLCRTEDALDLAAGLLDALSPSPDDPSRPAHLLALLADLFADPSLSSVTDAVVNVMTEDDFVAFAKVLTAKTGALPTDPAAFVVAYHRDIEIQLNDLLTTTLSIRRDDPRYSSLRSTLDEIIGPHERSDEASPHGTSRPVLFDLLDPARSVPVLAPMQKVLHCVDVNDPGSALPRMLYGLGFQGDLLGARALVPALDKLARIDVRQSLFSFAKTLLAAVRRDDEGLAAVRDLCGAAMDVRAGPGGAPSAAELLVPTAAELFEKGVSGEVLCVADTLLSGCSGGAQPACLP